MYAIYGNIYIHLPSIYPLYVSIYTIHGSYGLLNGETPRWRSPISFPRPGAVVWPQRGDFAPRPAIAVRPRCWRNRWLQKRGDSNGNMERWGVKVV